MTTAAELDAIFQSDGPLAQAVDGYVPRVAQRELTQAIQDTLDAGEVLIAEAGTGTGKTWAYLIPALLSDGKTLVSTGTRTLQDQLFRRDIPRLRKALGLPVRVALLKGRSNYVCHYHLSRLEQDERGLSSREEIAQLQAIRRFVSETDSGDKAELPGVPETADIWNRVTSTRENCLGQDCPFVRECFVLKARRNAQDADLVAVNHALFMADIALREEGVSDLLPQTGLVVFDEAHQLPDTATRFLGQSVSLYQILQATRLALAAGLAHAREAARWEALCAAVDGAGRTLRLAIAPGTPAASGRVTFEQLPSPGVFDPALDALLAALDDLSRALTDQAERHPDLLAASRTVDGLHARLSQWAQPGRDEPVAADQAAVRWLEYGATSLRLQRAPLSVAQTFSGFRRPGQAWVLTSATLSVRGDFSHLQQQLGLTQARTCSWASPFDYAVHGLLYVPDDLPLPGNAGFVEAFVQHLLPLVRACTGGVLVLCTTLRAVDQIADRLIEGLGQSPRRIMRQGEASRGVLLERFRVARGAVLVGSTSFWEGIDVPGDALTLVAIDKLPFAPPDDPVVEARMKACRAEGGHPFLSYQLPQAALLLKQGAGRLIRTERDAGVLLVGDTRLVDRPYGRLLWQGLPPFRRTRDAAVASAFLQALVPDTESA